jgi:hypothetical protein
VPLASILSATMLGDLTGRPEVERRGSAPMRWIFVGTLVGVGVLALAVSLPQLEPALQRLAQQAIPAEVRGQLVAGTARNPLDPCRPNATKTTFSTTESIYIGGYFTKPIPRGESGQIEIFVNGRSVVSDPVTSPIQAVQCYYEADPLTGAQPASYRLVVTYKGETIAEGEFTIR